MVKLLDNKIGIACLLHAVQKQESIKAGHVTIASSVLHAGVEGHSTAGLGDQ